MAGMSIESSLHYFLLDFSLNGIDMMGARWLLPSSLRLFNCKSSIRVK